MKNDPFTDVFIWLVLGLALLVAIQSSAVGKQPPPDAPPQAASLVPQGG